MILDIDRMTTGRTGMNLDYSSRDFKDYENVGKA